MSEEVNNVEKVVEDTIISVEKRLLVCNAYEDALQEIIHIIKGLKSQINDIYTGTNTEK